MESGTVGTSAATTNGAGKADETERLEVLNPPTGETIANLPVDGPEAVAATVARVRAAQPDWEAMGIEGRYHWLGQLWGWSLDKQDKGAHTTEKGGGKGWARAA